MVEEGNGENFDNLLCVVCQSNDTNGMRQCLSGISTLIDYSVVCGLEKLASYLSEKQERNEGVKIHIACQRSIGNTLRKKRANVDDGGGCSAKVAKRTTRGSVEMFNWKEHCFFCGKICKLDKKHLDRKNIHTER